MEKYDLIIVGAGPAGIFTAVELLRHGSKKKMLLVEKGKPVEKRHCPKAEVGHCVNCRPTCAITTGFSGAGAFSDGKLSLSYEVGGDLPTLIGEEFAQELIDYTDKIYLEFGADPHVEGIYTGAEIGLVDQAVGAGREAAHQLAIGVVAQLPALAEQLEVQAAATHGGVAQNGGALTGQLLQLQAGIVAAGVLQLYR